MKSKLQIQNIRVALFTLLMTMFSINCQSQGCPVDQSTAVFYTKASGTFSNPSIWEYQDSCGNWVEATLPPSALNACFIKSNYSVATTVTLSSMVIKSLLLETGSTFLLESELIVSGGSGGSGGAGGTGSGIQISGNIVITHKGRLLESDNAPVTILSGGSIVSSGEIHLRGDMTINGQFSGAIGSHGKLYLFGGYTQTITANSNNNNLGDVFVDKTLPSSELRIHNNALITTLDIPLLSMAKGTVKFFNQTKGFGFIKVEDSSEATIIAGTADLFVRGDMTVHGQFDGADCKLTFDGTSPQVITYDPPVPSPISNFGDVSFSNTSAAGLLLTGPPTAFFLSKKGYDYYQMQSNLACTFLESFTIGAGATMEFIGATAMSVGGDWTNDGTFIPGTGTVSFNSSGTSKIGGTTSPQNFYNLEVNKDSDLDRVDLDCDDLDVANDLTVTKGRSRKGLNAVNVRIVNRMSISPSGIFDGNSLDVFVGGDMTVHGQYDGALGKLTFDGTSAQVLDHSPVVGLPPSNFGEVIFDNVSGVDLTGTQDLILSKVLCKSASSATCLATVKVQLAFKLNSDATFSLFSGTKLFVGGDMTVNGQYNGVAGTLTFDGSSAQVLDHSPVVGSPPSNFGELVFDNPSTVQVGGTQDIDVLKKHTKTGHVTLLKRTTAAESFRVDAGSEVTIGPLVEVAVAGEMIVQGHYDGALGKLTFDGSSAQVLDHSPVVGSPPSNFGEVVYDNPSVAGVTVQGNEVPFVSEKKEFKGHVTLLKRTEARSSVVLYEGHVSFGNSIECSVGGDWTNNGGTFDPGTSTVIFNGTVLQKIEGVSSNFHNLTVDNLAGLEIRESPTLPRLTSVSGDLQLANGKLYLFGGQDLQLVSDATITGASPTRYIVTNGKGTLKRQLITIVGGPDTQMVYPVGTETGYNPVTYQLSSVTGQSIELGARVAEGVSTAYDTDENPIGNAILPRCVLKTYFATGTIPPGDHITIHPQWNAADEGIDFDRSVCDLAHYTGGQWIRSTPTAAVAGDPPGSYTGTFTATVTSLSPFAVFSQNSTSCSSIGEWTGVVSSDWSNPNNWCSGMLPTPTTNVVIPSGTPHQPTIAGGVVAAIVVAAVIAALTINSGATLTVSDNLELHLSGDMTVHGQYNGFDGKLVFDGAAAQVFDHSPDATSPPSNFGELIFSNTAGGVTVIGNTIPVFAREASAPSISEVVVTKHMDISGPVLIDTGAKFTVTATGELSVGGDMTVHGQYSGVDGKLTFDGTSPQVITYDPSVSSSLSNFGDVSFSNTSAAGVLIIGPATGIFLSKKGYDYYQAKTNMAMSFQESFTIGTGASMEVTGATDITVGGDWINNGGTFIPGAGTVIFNGSGNSIIGGTSSTQYFNDLTVNKSNGTSPTVWQFPVCHARTITIQSGILDAGTATDIFVSGDWINNGGTFTPRSCTVNFNGSEDAIIGGTSLNQRLGVVKVVKDLTGLGLKGVGLNLDILDVENIRLQSGELRAGTADISISGDWINNGGTFDPGTSTVSFYGGNGDSHIGGTATEQAFHKIRLRESPTLASTGQTKRTVCSGSTTTLRAHDIEISALASFDSGTATLVELSGDWTNDGEFIPNASEVKFSCGLAVCDSSNIRGTSTNFSKLTVFKPSGVVIRASVSFPSLTTVSGELKFTNGKIFLVGVGDVVINEDAIITGASPEKYIVSSCTHVYHPSNPSRLFPIGTTLGYSPVSIDLGGITTQGSLKTKATNLTATQLSTLGISEISHVSTLFTVEKDASLAFGSCVMTFNWDASLAIGNPALFQVVVRQPGSSLWISANVVSRTATSITIDGVSSLGEFAIGELGNSSAVNLKLFIEGYYIGGGAMASVKNNQDGVSPLDEVEDITVNLHDTAPPYSKLHTTTATLKTDGTAVCTFTTAPVGSFYIAVTSRNAIETWSATPQTVGVVSLTYDFSSSPVLAYGNNVVILSDGFFGFYSGDINQDEVIDASDAVDLTNDIDLSEFGVFVTDLNGDGSVDNSDMPFFSNNSEFSIFCNKP